MWPDEKDEELDALTASEIMLEDAPPLPCDLQMRFTDRDPLVVRLAVPYTGADGTDLPGGVWVVSRDLLSAALTGPAGIGNIRVAPIALPGAPLRIAIRLHGKHSRVTILLEHRALLEYLQHTHHMVPFGEEVEASDMNREIDLFFDSRH
ncbi:SsgA family sporulation/cell division regulator [Streptomyces sp. C1-2]|uniref:SsgA family sporulation/cell division regulator n=1 Tax=Streptomyces sp. C1-2 TaxID=2720022 RepID=UPI001432526E|nr:SsgA family sporulation/cell division regulator [Streptomyces sp. C1-2]NJP75043.1 SsgA family sporulation/cell division regulator [Streptomyces sp. C1-2]